MRMNRLIDLTWIENKMKIEKDNQGYIVLYDTDGEGFVAGTWGLRIVYGLEELEAEVSAILNEIESFDENDEENPPGSVDDITIFKVDDSFKFNVEVTEKVITTSTVKLEQKNKRILSPLKEVAAIRLSLGQPKAGPPISVSENDDE
jgi:hypothetical protein